MIPRTSVEKGVRRGVEKNLKQINSKVETRYTRVQIVFQSLRRRQIRQFSLQYELSLVGSNSTKFSCAIFRSSKT